MLATGGIGSIKSSTKLLKETELSISGRHRQVRVLGCQHPKYSGLKGGELMDSNHRDIPIIEDDMGEGFMDPIDKEADFFDKKQRELWKLQERLERHKKGYKI